MSRREVMVSAFVGTSVVLGAAIFGDPVGLATALLAGIISLLPGLSVTQAQQ